MERKYKKRNPERNVATKEMMKRTKEEKRMRR